MSKKSTSIVTIRLFWHHATRYKRFLVPLILSIPIVVVLMNFVEPYIISLVLEKISTNAYDSQNIWASFKPYIVAYAFAVLASGVAGWRLNIWLIWNLEMNVIRDMSQRIFDHLINMSPAFHSNRFAGSLVSQANKLTGAYVRFADATIFNLYTLVVSMIAAIVILAPRVPIYAVVLLTLSVVYIVGAIFFSRPVRDANMQEAQAQSQQTGTLADTVTNIMAVKSFSTSDFEKDRYAAVVANTRAKGLKSMRATTIRETYASSITSTINIAALLIAVAGANVFKTNVATLFLIVTYTSNIGMRLWEFQNVLRQYNRALGDAADMVTILQIEPSIKDPEHPEESRIIRGSINLRDVTFTHDENNKALFNKLNLRIKPGEKVGLVGHSGSGKTTLTRLLLRFSDIDSGTIEIDGQDITKITQDELRKHIAYVPQEPLLFHRSLAENIAYGSPDSSQREIRAIAKLAHADNFINDLPQGYDTLVGERGVKLSGGQRQRVAIARAMLKNAPILILDEATSALDSESEDLIQDALWTLMENRTAIVIAHRLSTIQRMDRIIVLENGKIIEQGSHRELIKHGRVYADLWDRQSGGFIED